MAQSWYPIVNEDLCSACGSCVDFCQNGVLEADGLGIPKVVKPEGCVEFCRGCSKLCPSEAITYFGDN